MYQDLVGALDGKLHFDSRRLSFCTCYSWFGLVKDDKLGIEQVHLFYNRRPALLSPDLLTFQCVGDSQKSRMDWALRIEERGEGGFAGVIEFLDADIVCYHAKLEEDSGTRDVQAVFSLPETNPKLERSVTYDKATRLLTVKTHTPRTDQRDPDPIHPLMVCMMVPEAFEVTEVSAAGVEANTDDQRVSFATDKAFDVKFTGARNGLLEAEQTFVLGIGEGPSAEEIEARMSSLTAVDSAASSKASSEWLESALDKFSFDGIDEGLRTHYAKATYQILCNTKTPRGQMKRYGVFPNRGTYCSHYLWDACFTNLGVARFNQQLAEDFILALCDTQEEDGKMAQFVCATWNRPGESQPPLIAWAAWRLYMQYENRSLVEQVYEPLCKMVNWWFEKRDADGDGLAEYQDPLESGWDNSPRFDFGRIAGVDLNAYLNREMRILSRMARLLNKESEAIDWDRRAAQHGRQIVLRLFDYEDGVFYDRLVAEDRFVKVLTPASFAPLWAGVDVPRETAHNMIFRRLLNPKEFFGACPFPVVSYSDSHHEPGKWWRGPVWPNIAWAMTEVLRNYGLEREHQQAVERLVDMMLNNEELSELYNSATGEALGAPGLCWGCAVFMDLAAQRSAG